MIGHDRVQQGRVEGVGMLVAGLGYMKVSVMVMVMVERVR